MLKILFLCPYLPHIGIHAGAGRIFNLIMRLSQKYSISVLSYLEREEERQYIPELKKYCQKVEIVLRRNSSFLFDFSPKIPFFWCYSREMKKTLLGMLKEEKFDILQIEYLEMAHYIFFAPPITTILTIHEPTSKRNFDFLKYETKAFKKISLLFNYVASLNFEMNICKKFDIVINITENDKRLLSSFSPRLNSFVIPTGVDISYFKPDTIREEPNSLLYVGYFIHRPNADAVLYFCKEILPLIQKEVPEVKLYLVGSFPTQEVLSLANENIFVTGRVDDLRPYYDKTKVFIAPIRLGGGIRGKILEAWAMGKPVVSTSLAATSVGAIDGENILIADKEEDFAQKVILLLKNEDLRKKIGSQGRKTVEEIFDWDRIVNSLDALYQDVAMKKKR